VNPNGLGTNVNFAYGTNPAYSVTASGSQYVGSATSAVPFSLSISGLSCATTYTYYAVGSNSAGASAGQWQTFTTSSCTAYAPTVSAESVDDVTQTSAVLHASINPNGFSTTAAFQYGATPSSPIVTSFQSIGSSTSAATIAWAVNGLSCGTTYSYDAVGINSAGTSLGPWKTFTTLACNVSTAPIISNQNVGSITAGSAILYAQVDPRSLRTNTSFQYGTIFSDFITTESLPISGLAQLDQYIDGLRCATTYTWDAMALSSGGETLGPWLTFTTGACGQYALPAEKDVSVDGIGQIAANFHASVNPNGATTGVYFQYGTDQFNLSATASQLLAPSTDWQFVTVALPGGALICGTTYYFQVVIYNNTTWQGVYSIVQPFSTLPCGQPGTAGWPINLVTGSADSITQTKAVLHGSANPNGAATSGFFILYPEPFPSPGFTSSPVNLGDSNTDQSFTVTVTGLSCNTTYDYLADAINQWGESNAGSYRFTTLSCSGIDTIFNDGFESGTLGMWQTVPP
jgi:hypothetical protein